MRKVKMSGVDILESAPSSIRDTDNNLIFDDKEYIVTFLVDDDNKEFINSIRDINSESMSRVALMCMAYADFGFKFITDSLEKNKDITIEIISTSVDKMIDMFVNIEDYESADKLTKEWKEFNNES